MVACSFDRRGRSLAEESLEELAALAEAAGAVVLDRVLQERPAPDPAFFVGRGKAEELRQRVEARGLDVLMLDDELSPGQQRNLENLVGCKILDRTQLILDIFAARARTREGKLQVELAQLSYLLPRLAGKGILLSRLGAGIGTRGPGETKLEMDRRRIRSRIARLRRELESIRLHRGQQRTKRQGIPLPVVALVGYTNAGKSTLFNRLTDAGTEVSPRLFATLDPLLRRVTLPNGLEIVLSDTVGFVRKLPHDIVAAFRATLEEVRQADLLLHVVDVSNPRWQDQAAAVDEVLEELGVSGTPTIRVYNKTDILPSGVEMEQDVLPGESAALVSARVGTGVATLLLRVAEELEAFSIQLELKIPYREAALLSRIYDEGRVYSEAYESDGVRLDVELPRSTARSLNQFVKGVR